MKLAQHHIDPLSTTAQATLTSFIGKQCMYYGPGRTRHGWVATVRTVNRYKLIVEYPNGVAQEYSYDYFCRTFCPLWWKDNAELAKGYLSPVEGVLDEVAPVAPDEDLGEFMVMRVGYDAPTKVHTSYSAAEAEAKRIAALHTGSTVRVFRIVSTVKSIAVTTHNVHVTQH